MHRKCHFAGLIYPIVLLALAAIGRGASAPAAVRTPRILREGQPDTHSLESIVSSIVKPGMSQRDKAMAVYDFVRNHVYHWGPAREHPDRNSYDYGVVYDPVKLINVYGYGYCFQNRAAAEALWEAAGLEARCAGIGGHSIAEVFYDGQYHYLDSDQHGYCLLPDGLTVASIAQVERDPIALILNQPKPSNPFFPAGRDPKVPYESKVLFAAYFASTADNFYQHDKIVTGHRMDITLLLGMLYQRRFAADGRWNIHNSGTEFEYKVGYHDPRRGPKDFLSDTGYANGDLLYQPDLTSRSTEYAAGVWEDANIGITDAGLAPAAAGKPAWCVFRIRLPYAIVGWPTSFQGAAACRGAAVVSARFHGRHGGQGVDVSVDHGLTWKPVWTNTADGASAQAVADLSDDVVARYEYWVRLRLADEATSDARLESLAIRTGFQLAPRALPALRPGDNPMVFSLGDQSETLEIVPNLKSAADFTRHVQSHKGIWLQEGRLTSKLGRPGEVIFELKPPRAGTVTGFSAEAGCRREPFGLHADDDIKIYYALNRPEDWILAYDDEFPPSARHWCYHANAAGDCPPGTRALFVKFAVRTAASASIQQLRLRLRWRPAEDAGMPERGLRIVHGWSESGADKEFAVVVRSERERYAVRAGADPVNRFLTLAPVRAPGLAWRADDPPSAQPPMPEQEVLDGKLCGEMRSLLRAIDADPLTGLPAAAACGIDWLAGGAKQAQAMYAAKFPVAPRPADPAANPFRDGAGRAAAEKTMSGADWYAKLRIIDDVRAAGVRELPEPVIAALADPSRYVRLAALQAVRAARDARAAAALRAMVRKDPLAWLREEAKSVLNLISASTVEAETLDAR